MYCNVDINPIKPSSWWDDFLAKAIVLNSKQCQGCAEYKTKIRSIVIRKKDKHDERREKVKEKNEYMKDLATHRYMSHSFFTYSVIVF
jgi:hypothetical protein